MERLGILQIFGICRADNVASIRVLEKCGFALEYIGEGNYHGDTHNICRYAYSITRTVRLLIRPFKPEDWLDLYDYL